MIAPAVSEALDAIDATSLEDFMHTSEVRRGGTIKFTLTTTSRKSMRTIRLQALIHG